MSKRLTWMCVWAVMFALCGCSDEGNKERDSEKTCDPACADGFECRNGACVEKDDKIEPGTDNACDSCKAGEICVNKKCEPCPHVVCGDKCCGENEVCEADKCSLKTAEGCDSCSPDQICEDQTCKACPNAVCDQVCCSEGQVCDLFTKKCAVAGMDGGAPCNGLFCFEGQVCSETGECAVRCDDGRYGCGDNAVCCDANSECFEDTYCRVVCDADQTMCGKVGAEVCCAADQVCEQDTCMKPCEGTRCGENLEFCCDSAKEVCAFNRCVEPTSENSCSVNEDCDLWSFCDDASKRCISQSEDTNACTYHPPVGEFKPKVKWHWTNGTGVHGTPIVVNLTDDNGDGKIDENDIPEVVTNTNYGELVALDGKTGKPWAITEQYIYNMNDDIAGADIDNDGKVEILVPTFSKPKDVSKLGLDIVNLEKQQDGTYKWVRKYFIPATNYWGDQANIGIDLHPTIMDIDSNGTPDIVTTDGVILGEDFSKVHCKLGIKGKINYAYYDLFAVGDLDQDGNAEIISEALYDKDCNVLIPADSTRWLYTAYADLLDDENDPERPGELVPEIVRVGNGIVSVWKMYRNGDVWSQKKVWEKNQTSKSGGGNPVIADFDGDGKPDIGVAGRTHLTVFNGQTGDIVWASKTQDATSEKTGASVFDFEGDGIAEVVYRDEVKIRIYAGPGAGKDKDDKIIDADKDGYMDGKILWEEPKTSGTIIDYPLIVDVDNDGRTDIVIASNIKDWTPAGMEVGITVYSDSNDNWVRTRRIWNEHAYHVTNINEDGTVPTREPANWLNRRLNNYRANTQPSSGFNAPNFVPDGLSASRDRCKDQILKITAGVKNVGSLGISVPISVSFYISDYEHEGNKYSVYLGTAQTSAALAPDGAAKVEFDWNGKGTILVEGKPVEIAIAGEKHRFTYVVDDDHGAHADYIPFNECHEEDNIGLSDEVEICPPVVN
ncbi:MAG: VCBS repeat-containing protein [Proteobacteria bacterium]|nr:VCBS repeat-containing protein [Pseudomonadota bacterium]